MGCFGTKWIRRENPPYDEILKRMEDQEKAIRRIGKALYMRAKLEEAVVRYLSNICLRTIACGRDITYEQFMAIVADAATAVQTDNNKG